MLITCFLADLNAATKSVSTNIFRKTCSHLCSSHPPASHISGGDRSLLFAQGDCFLISFEHVEYAIQPVLYHVRVDIVILIYMLIICFVACLHTGAKTVVTNIFRKTFLHGFLSPFRIAYCVVRS